MNIILHGGENFQMSTLFILKSWQAKAAYQINFDTVYAAYDNSIDGISWK